MCPVRSLVHTTLAMALLAGVLACSSSGSSSTNTASHSSGGSGTAASSSGTHAGGSAGAVSSASASGGSAGASSSGEGGRSGGAGGGTGTTSGGAGVGGTGTTSKGTGGTGGGTGGSGTSMGGSGTSTGGNTGGSGTSLGGTGGGPGGASGTSRDAGANQDGSGDVGTSSGDSGGGVNSPGCGTSITKPSANTQQTMTVGGKTRYYLLDVPSSADNKKPLMLIFALHGYNMNNISIQGLFNFTSRSNGTAITVYPQGEGDPPGNVSHWGSGISSTFEPNEANYTFIHDLMMDLEKRYCVDTSRVFLAGFSMGGLFTNFAACDHSEWFRAYAPVEGMGPGGSQDGTKPLSCANANAKPAIMIHQGSADTSVKPEQGEKTRDFWVKQNGCGSTTTTSFTGCNSYPTCAQPVVYCAGSWSHTIDPQATSNIWSFFSGL